MQGHPGWHGPHPLSQGVQDPRAVHSDPKRVWSRDQLLEKIWGVDFIGDTKTVDVHIRWLREKVEKEPSSPQLIRTVRGFGYRFG